MRRTWLRATTMPRSRAAAVSVSSVHSASPLGAGFPFAAQLIDGFAWWGELHQGKNRTAFRFGEPRLAPRARFHPQAVEPALVEGVPAVAHRLRMPAQFVGDLAGACAIPAARDHLGMERPIGGRMVAMSKLADLTRFSGSEGRTSGEMLRHGGTPPAPHSHAYFTLLLRNAALYGFWLDSWRERHGAWPRERPSC